MTIREINDYLEYELNKSSLVYNRPRRSLAGFKISLFNGTCFNDAKSTPIDSSLVDAKFLDDYISDFIRSLKIILNNSYRKAIELSVWNNADNDEIIALIKYLKGIDPEIESKDSGLRAFKQNLKVLFRTDTKVLICKTGNKFKL